MGNDGGISICAWVGRFGRLGVRDRLETSDWTGPGSEYQSSDSDQRKSLTIINTTFARAREEGHGHDPLWADNLTDPTPQSIHTQQAHGAASQGRTRVGRP